MKADICYLCAARDSTEPYSTVGSFRLVRCVKCGLVSTPGVSPEEIQKLYEDEAYYSEKGGSGFDIEGFLAHGLADGLASHLDQNRFQPLFREVKQRFGGSTVNYLDVGCSAGLMLAIAREYGWKPRGIEASNVAAVTAAEKLGLDVKCSPVDNMDLGVNTFQAISLFHVLEHLHDPRAVLKKIRASLADNGVFALEVPNINSLPARLRKSDWHGYVLPYHLWHFSPSTLKLLLEQEGFKVIQHSTPYLPCATSHIINVHAAASKLARKILRRDSQSAPGRVEAQENKSSPAEPLIGSQTSRKWLERAVRTMYWPTDQLLAHTGQSEALYVLAVKS